MAQVVIQSEAKNLEGVHVDVIEILPPFGRLNDNYGTLTNYSPANRLACSAIKSASSK